MSGLGFRFIGAYLLITGASWLIPFMMRMNGVAREMRPLYFFLNDCWKGLIAVPSFFGIVLLAFWLHDVVSSWSSRSSSKQDTVSSFKNTRPEGYKDPYQIFLEQERLEKIAKQKLEEEKREAEARERRRIKEEQRRTRSPEEATEAALRDF